MTYCYVPRLPAFLLFAGGRERKIKKKKSHTLPYFPYVDPRMIGIAIGIWCAQVIFTQPMNEKMWISELRLSLMGKLDYSTPLFPLLGNWQWYNSSDKDNFTWLSKEESALSKHTSSNFIIFTEIKYEQQNTHDKQQNLSWALFSKSVRTC